MRLVIEDASGTRSVVRLASDEITLGRARDGNTFRLDDRNVSRRHARLVRASGALFIEDLGSLNGTRVNGERISGRRRLREGDLVEIGDYDLALLPEEDRPDAPPALRPTPAPGSAAPPSPGATPRAPGPEAPVPASAGATPPPASAGAPGPPPAPAPAPAAPAPASIAAAPAADTAPAATTAPSPPPTAIAPAAVEGLPAPPPQSAASTAAAPRAPGPVGRALRLGAIALAIGFAAGWTVGTLTAPGPRPAGTAPAAR